MRGLRSTIALIVVLAGLAAYVYFVTWQKTPETAASKQEKVFAGVEADNTRTWPKKDLSRLDAEDENKYDECLACQ